MRELFKRTKMMDEAKIQGKPKTPSSEFFSFIIVYLLCSYLQSFILSAGSLYYFMSDEKLYGFLHSATPNLEAALSRMEQLMSAAPEWLSILLIFLTVVYFFGAVVYCKKFDKRKLSTIGIRKANYFKEYLTGFALGFVMITALAFLGFVTNTFKFNGLAHISLPVLACYFFAYAIQGFSEEVLIHGYYFSAVSKNSGVIYSLVSSSILFAFIHTLNFGLSMTTFLNLFLFGMIGGLCVIKRGNIWAASALHFSWNFAQMIFFGFNYDGNPTCSSVFSFSATKGFDGVTGGVFGPENGLFVTLILFIAIGLIWKFKQNQNEIAVQPEADDEKNI